MSRAIIAAVPVLDAPDYPSWPQNTYSEYTEGQCHLCSAKVWLGTRSRLYIEQGQAISVCMVCVITKLGANSETTVQKLTDLDGQA